MTVFLALMHNIKTVTILMVTREVEINWLDVFNRLKIPWPNGEVLEKD
jgi:hypothetical protein